MVKINLNHVTQPSILKKKHVLYLTFTQKSCEYYLLWNCFAKNVVWYFLVGVLGISWYFLIFLGWC